MKSLEDKIADVFEEDDVIENKPVVQRKARTKNRARKTEEDDDEDVKVKDSDDIKERRMLVLNILLIVIVWSIGIPLIILMAVLGGLNFWNFIGEWLLESIPEVWSGLRPQAIVDAKEAFFDFFKFSD